MNCCHAAVADAVVTVDCQVGIGMRWRVRAGCGCLQWKGRAAVGRSPRPSLDSDSNNGLGYWNRNRNRTGCLRDGFRWLPMELPHLTARLSRDAGGQRTDLRTVLKTSVLLSLQLSPSSVGTYLPSSIRTRFDSVPGSIFVSLLNSLLFSVSVPISLLRPSQSDTVAVDHVRCCSNETFHSTRSYAYDDYWLIYWTLPFLWTFLGF